jgi:hypothetical protein
MKRTNLGRITRTAGVLTLATMLAFLGQATAATSAKGKAAVKAPVKEAKFTVLNPVAPLPEIDTKALSPRLSSFAGKTIVIFDDRGGYAKPMEGLADQLKPLLPPDTKLVYYAPPVHNHTPATLAQTPKGDAVIVGHAY